MSNGHDSAFVPTRFVIGEFAGPDELLAGATKIREKGHRKVDTHTPYPIHGIEKALGLGRPKIPTIVLLAALTGAVLGYGMMLFMNAIDWPINVANRPPHSAPAFIPITFELTILLGGTSAFFGLMALMKLPQPYHPLFESDAFRRASIDGFFLSVEVPLGEDPVEAGDDMRLAGAKDVQIIEESER
jgi:hypothetical protein